jgi:hypothetical protein
MIERVSDSYDLYLTTFFLCHWLLKPKEGLSAVSGEKVSPEVVDVWKRAMVNFEETKYHDNGERVQPPHMYCKIRHSESSTPYIVQVVIYLDSTFVRIFFYDILGGYILFAPHRYS